jgi:hypothetical protein
LRSEITTRQGSPRAAAVVTTLGPGPKLTTVAGRRLSISWRIQRTRVLLRRSMASTHPTGTASRARAGPGRVPATRVSQRRIVGRVTFAASAIGGSCRRVLPTPGATA